MASFQRNGQRISILNPLDEPPPSPPTPSTTTSVTARQLLTDGALHSPIDASFYRRESLSPSPRGTSGSEGPTRKLHQCGVCLKCFTTSGHLTRHARIHSGVKPHVCPYPGCDKDCSRLDNLIQHYRVHLPKEDRGRGNPHIRACMLDLPVPVVVPPSQQDRVLIERTDSPEILRFARPEQNKPLSLRKMSFASNDSSMSDLRTPMLTSPTESGSTATAPLHTPADEEDAKLLASLWQGHAYAGRKQSSNRND